MNRRIPFQAMTRDQREAALERIERLTELPLLLLAFVMIPVLIGPMLWEPSGRDATLFRVLDGFIWAVFAADYAVKLAVAPDRLRYLRTHWFEAVIVLVPFIRPLRIVRIFLFGSRALLGTRRLLNVDFLLVYALGMVVIAATVVTTVERGHESIDSFPDALWWSIVTVTTVGYGDMTPVTPAGRAMAVFLMLTGIGLFGGLTANLASVMVRSENDVEENVKTLLREVRHLRSEVGAGFAQAPPTPQRTRPPLVPSISLPLRAAANIIPSGIRGALGGFRRNRRQTAASAQDEGVDMPDAQTFRQAWGKFATGVSVVTTVRPDGEIHGMTANGINSVSLEPPLALVCAGHSTSSHPLIREAGRFAINILSEGQRPIAEYYARPTADKTGDVETAFTRTERGAALIDGCIARMDCRVIAEHDAGDHTVFIGQVEEIDTGEGRPLLFYEGKFARLPDESD